MKERPILFSASMVRAILDGSKVQTRRVMKPQPRVLSGDLLCWKDDAMCIDEILGFCPYGQPGDRIFVRETTQLIGRREDDKVLVRYEADGQLATVDWPGRLKPLETGKCIPNGCHREAARIDLEITSVRVERLQDISRGDAMAEGCPFPNMATGDDPRQWYRDLWESLNGPGSWDANPWVWVIEFRRIK